MKKVIIAAIIAAAIFAAASCKKSEAPAPDAFTSVAEFEKWLSGKPDNDVNTVYTVKLNIDDLGGISSYPGSVGYALSNAEQKYVHLDFSGSTFTVVGNEFYLYAFTQCDSLVGITLPNTVTDIGIGAFSLCVNLSSITVPDSVTRIREAAFLGCTGLINVSLGNGVKNIDNTVFTGCTGIKSITIPASVTGIGKYSFIGCENLTEITIQGIVSLDNINDSESPFHGDLQKKYIAGGIGTYTTTAPVGDNSVWTNISASQQTSAKPSSPGNTYSYSSAPSPSSAINNSSISSDAYVYNYNSRANAIGMARGEYEK